MERCDGHAVPTMASRKKMTRRAAKCVNKYSATLPFDAKKAPWTTVAYVLEATKKGWKWYTAAQETDVTHNTQLGTLSYLPREIRDKIYEMVLDVYFEPLDLNMIISTGGFDDQKAILRDVRYGSIRSPIRDSWCKICSNPSIGYYDHYYCGCNRPMFSIRASSTLRDEFDELYLSESVFTFNTPEFFTSVLANFSSTQQSFLQRIVIDLGSHCPCQLSEWKKGMEIFSGEPLSLDRLKVVYIAVGYTNIKYSRWSCHYYGLEDRGVGKMVNLDKIRDILEVITKQIKRSAPGVTFIVDQDNLVNEDRLAIERVLGEVE